MRIDRLVSTWAHKTPDQVAVDGTNEAMTYAELDALANRFANLFRSAGVAAGDRVGVHLPRSARAMGRVLLGFVRSLQIASRSAVARLLSPPKP